MIAGDGEHDIEGGLAARLADLIVRFRWLWLAVAILMTGVAAIKLPNIWPPESDARIFFAEENPDRQALDKFEATFSKDDNLMIILAPKDGEVFTPRTLAAIGDITDAAWLLPFVRRVDSLTNFQHTYAEGDEMIVRDLVPDPAATSPEEAASAKAIALDQIELVNSMIAPPGDVTQVQVKFLLPQKDTVTEVPSIVAEAMVLRDRIREDYPFLEVKLTGSVMINNQFSVSGQEDGQNLMGPMFIVILAIVLVTIWSVFGALSVLIVILLSAVAALGLMGWMNLRLNSVTVLAPLYIMTLAVASSVHVLTAVRQNMHLGGERLDWVRKALTDHMGAITIACITTALGFLSLNFSISPPFRQLGTVVGFGVLAAMINTLTLLPALIAILPTFALEKKLRGDRVQGESRGVRLMAWIAELVITRRGVLLPASLVVVVALGAGVSQIKLEDDFIRYFDERYEFRRDSDFTENRLVGMNALEWSLTTGEDQGINDPAYLAAVSSFVDWLRDQPEVGYARSVTDTLKRLNMNMHGDDPAKYTLPTDRDEASQFLFLYELSLGYGMDLTDQIDVARSTMRVTALTPNVTTAHLRDLSLRASDWLESNAPQVATAFHQANPGIETFNPTGVSYVFTLISYRDVRAMLLGTFIAVVMISGVIMLALRDVRIGLISLIPNLIPAIMAFGLWGYTVGAVTLAISVVVAATLGIVVDDTVHFLSKYSRARKAGKSPEDAVRYTFRSVGMALLITTVGLVAGFAVLAQSGFAVNGDMAKLTAITITIALIADFILLPSLLIWLDSRKPVMSLSPKTAAIALFVTSGLAAGLFATGALAGEAEEKGRAIAVEADNRDLGYGDFEVGGEMVLRSKGGSESRRVFRNMVLEEADASLGDKSVIVFTEPRDIRGTGLLTHANIEPNDDDQWLYLPAVKRVKRISSSNRTGKFVSSEFSYEDLGSQEVDDYTYKWLRDEPCPTDSSLNCFVTESYPKNPKSGYSKRISWIDSAEYRLQKVDFYNRRGDLEKVLTFTGYQQYLGKFWRAAQMSMINQQTGKSTDLLWTGYKFQVGLGQSDFREQRLPAMAR